MARDLDLNLLRTFDAVVTTQSVSEAAARLNLSVPATSRALGRLRRAMGDPILVRAGRGLVPTPFATRSAGRVRQLLDGVAELLTDTDETPPRSWRRTFSIRVNDGVAPALAPRMIAQIAREAPMVTLRFVIDHDDHPEPLRDGTLDLDIGVTYSAAPDIRTQSLYAEHLTALVSADSALGQSPELTVDQLCAYPHVSATFGGPTRPIDDALAQLGRQRRVVAVVPTYATAALLALENDVIVMVPNMLAQYLLDRGLPVRAHALPLALPPVAIQQRWHHRLDQDRPLKWLRSHVFDAIRGAVQDEVQW